jgi:hypothetical protein
MLDILIIKLKAYGKKSRRAYMKLAYLKLYDNTINVKNAAGTRIQMNAHFSYCAFR